MKMIFTTIELELDVNGAKKSLDKEFEEILMDAARAWVREVASIVPNWSGMSRASLQPIADLVDYPLFAGPVPGAPNRVSQGRAEGYAELRIKGGQFHFYWESSVFHYVFNENNNANNYGFHLRNPGPYHSVRRANKAFFEVLNRRLQNLTFEIGKHIKKRKRVVSSG